MCIGTDDPMQFHHTVNPLLEEYAMVTQHFGMSLTSKCEMARNSVLTSTFDAALKREWLGEEYVCCDQGLPFTASSNNAGSLCGV